MRARDKRPTGFRVDDHTVAQIRAMMEVDGSKSFQEFCDRAVKFYLAYLDGKDHENYVTRTLDSALRGMFSQFETGLRRTNSMVAIAVEELMLANVLTHEYTPEELRRVRGKAAEVIKKHGGPASMEANQREILGLLGLDGDGPYPG